MIYGKTLSVRIEQKVLKIEEIVEFSWRAIGLT
jgi:hypothetical protein